MAGEVPVEATGLPVTLNGGNRSGVGTPQRELCTC